MSDTAQIYGIDLSSNKVVNNVAIKKSLGSNNNFEGQIVVTFTCATSALSGVIPPLKTPYSSGSTYLLIDAEQKEIGADLWQVQLTYYTSFILSDVGGTGLSAPPDSYNEQTGYEEVSLALHPNFASWSTGWDYQLEMFTSGPKIGKRSFVAGVRVVTKTEYYPSLPGDPSGSVGRLESPNTSRYGSDSNWLCIGAVVGESNGWFTITKTFKYSSVPWDSDFYTY